MAEKSAKGQKIGRNSRAPSNKMQTKRTERNKRFNAERAHALKMQQMPAGGKSAEIYKGSHSIDSAAKFVSGCMALWDAKQRRISIHREMVKA